ncbi:SCO family protein [Bacillus tianshenii]|uniref:SCO family protein n=1 Tax=Sutcliffiella tianshenii TaxID=1463404 RepID=UPI001CD46206|nr:SCO family protein [Bacillus tianshenii]MCA1321119.1 SCO family protein [Bacillus tianshenii]
MKLLSIFLAMTLLLAACGTSEKEGIPDATDRPLGDFSYTNQDGNAFSLEDIKGDITIASLIFTSCTTVCSPITANLAKLQRMAEKEGLDVHFLSFSVDPEVDTPEKLKEFGNQFEADYSKWNFLTGYSQEEIETFGPENFKTIVAKPKNGGEVVHGTSIYLIDQEGTIVKSYDGLDVPFEEILEHVKILQNK